MKLTRTARGATTAAVFGLAGALFAGIAFAAAPRSARGAGGFQPTAIASVQLVETDARGTAATTAVGGNAPLSAQAPTGTATMTSEMLASLSPQARVEFQALYPRMLQLMDNSPMMSATGTVGSIMGTSTTGIGPSSGRWPAAV